MYKIFEIHIHPKTMNQMHVWEKNIDHNQITLSKHLYQYIKRSSNLLILFETRNSLQNNFSLQVSVIIIIENEFFLFIFVIEFFIPASDMDTNSGQV